jgi:putative DNA primase/helicase
MLLADLRTLFFERGADRLSSEEIVAALVKMEDRPWPELRGKPITTRGVARLVRPFGIEPGSVRFGGGTDTRKGYLREWFEDAWSRYLPPNPAHPEQGSIGTGHTVSHEPTRPGHVPEHEVDRTLAKITRCLM